MDRMRRSALVDGDREGPPSPDETGVGWLGGRCIAFPTPLTTSVMCDGRNPASGSKRCRIGSIDAMSSGGGTITIARRVDVLVTIG